MITNDYKLTNYRSDNVLFLVKDFGLYKRYIAIFELIKERSLDKLLLEMSSNGLVDLIGNKSFKKYELFFVFIKSGFNNKLFLIISKKTSKFKRALNDFKGGIRRLLGLIESIGLKPIKIGKAKAKKLRKLLNTNFFGYMKHYKFFINIEEENFTFFNHQTRSKNIENLVEAVSGLKEFFISIPRDSIFFIRIFFGGRSQKADSNNKGGIFSSVFISLGQLLLKNKDFSRAGFSIIDKIHWYLFGESLKHFREKTYRGKFIDMLLNKPFLVPHNVLSLLDYQEFAKKMVILLNEYFIEHSLHSDKFIPLNSRSNGDIFVGFQLYMGAKSIPFYLKNEDLIRHTFIVGPSGKGKTTLAKIMIEEIVKRGLGIVWVIDFHGEYAYLKDYGFELIRPGHFDTPLGLNIFDPPYESHESYATFITNLFIELMSDSSDLSPQMERALSISVSETIRDYRDGYRNPVGFIYNLWKWANGAKNSDVSNPILTFYAIINRLNTFFSGAVRSVFWVKRNNVNIEMLLRRNVVIDLSELNRQGASKKELMLFVNVFLRFILSYLFKRGIQSDSKVFLFIEEAKYLVPWRNRESSANTTVLEDFAVLARKYGLFLITITQSVSSISRDILENSGTKILFGTDGLKELNLALGSEIEMVLNTLPPKQAIVLLGAESAMVHVEIRDYSQELPKKEAKKIYYGDRVIQDYEPILIPFEKVIDMIVNDETDILEVVEMDYLNKILNECKLCKESMIDISSVLTLLTNLTNKDVNSDILPTNVLYLIEKIRNNPSAFYRIGELPNKNSKKIIECLLCIIKELYKDQEKHNNTYLDIEWEIEDIKTNILTQKP